MSNDETTPRDIIEGASARSGTRGRRTGRRLAAVATGTTLALGAGGIAYAATTDPAPTPSAPSTTPEGSDGGPSRPGDERGERDGHRPDGGFGHHGGVDVLLGPGGMPLHGEQVVETDDGVYQTVATQRGTVDALSEHEITVTSEDGYTRTYTLTPDSLTSVWPDGSTTVDLAVGDEVMLSATVESGTATVTHAFDVSEFPPAVELPLPGGERPGWGRGPDERPGDADTSAVPDTAA